MKSTVERLRDIMTFSEIQAIKSIAEEIGLQDEGIVITSKIASESNITKSILIHALRLLEVAGVTESRSLGARGTYIKVLDRATLNDLVA